MINWNDLLISDDCVARCGGLVAGASADAGW